MDPIKNNSQKKILTPSTPQVPGPKPLEQDKFVSIADKNSIKENDSNFIFFFGKPQVGKSVILASLLYQMNARSGSLRPKLSTPNTKEAEVLLFDMLDEIRKGILPRKTIVDQVTRIDLIFEPNNKSSKVNPINLTFLEMSGENLQAVSRGGSFHRSIDEYLNANIPLNFILVTDYNNADIDDTLMMSFFNELEKKNRKYRRINAILIIAKWDKSGNIGIPDPEHLNNFIANHMPMTNNQIDNYEFFKTYYTVGEVFEDDDGKHLSELNLITAEMLTQWLYKSIAGIDIDYPGTFWERLFGKLDW